MERTGGRESEMERVNMVRLKERKKVTMVGCGGVEGKWGFGLVLIREEEGGEIEKKGVCGV